MSLSISFLCDARFLFQNRIRFFVTSFFFFCNFRDCSPTTTHLEAQVLALTLVLTLWLATELGLVVALVSAMA